MNQHPNQPAGQIALMVALGALLIVAGLVWGSTGLAGVLFGGGWPHMTISALAHAVMALPEHLANPRQAWPAPSRAGMSGPVGFYLTLAVLVAGSAAVIAGIWRARQAGILSGDGDARARERAGDPPAN